MFKQNTNMFNKNFERDVIYFLELVLILCASAKPMMDREEINILDDYQLDYLSLVICQNFLEENEDECTKKFFGPTTSSPPLSTPVMIRCQDEGSITIQVEPAKNWQLVVLIPEPNIGDSDINYALLKPPDRFDNILIAPDRNYSIWRTELIDGTPLLWERGDLIPLYNNSAKPEHRDYDIQVTYYNTSVDGKLQLYGLAEWNTTGDADVCFYVTNTCHSDSYRLLGTSLLPNRKPQVVLSNLPTNDTCTLRVKGFYGVTKLEHNTSSCTDLKTCEPGTIRALLTPAYIYVSASEAEDDTWKVYVNWTHPFIQPDHFKITLLAAQNVTNEVPGDVTETVFEGVVGTWIYYVVIDSIVGEIAARKVERAIFPGRSGGAWRVAAWGGGAGAGAGAAALCALCAALACRRRCAAPRAAPGLCYPQDEKPPKDEDMQPMGPEPETTEDSWEIRSDRLLLHEVIGEGAFGVVRRGTMMPGGKDVAVKMLKDFPSLEEIRSFRSEMELMKSVGAHRHIVSLVGCCSGRRPLLVAEFCSRGDLLSYLRCCWDVIISKRNAKYYNNNIDTSDYRNDLFKCKLESENSKLVVNKLYDLQSICEKDLTPLDLLSFCRQIAMGMEFLASNRVVHRDLAARNILVTSDKTLKIADFGLSRDVYEENQYKQKGNGKMPVKWMALESLTRRIYTTQSDVWSFGVVVWEVVTLGGSPYAGVAAARLPRLLRAGYRMPRPAHCSPLLYDIMASCWHANPRERPGFPELHARLDELLHGASAHQYLALQLDADEPPPPPPTLKPHTYFKMLIRGKRNWSRAESYERPLKAPQSNHYTSPPAAARALPA